MKLALQSFCTSYFCISMILKFHTHSHLRCVGTAQGLNRHALGHDAFGYLLNYHQRGPGYCYMELNAVGCCGCGKRLVRTDPVGGQHTGFYWWIKYIYGSCAAAFACCLCLPLVLHRSYPNRRPSHEYEVRKQ